MMERRKFLKVLGIGTASAPLAAKALADQEAMALTSLAKNGMLASGAGIATPGIVGDKAYNDQPIKMANYLKVFGKVPDHVERETRLRTKYVPCLDPDIANKRSWSLAVKIQEQRQRNYENELLRYKEMGWYEMAQNKFAAITGFTWRNW